MAQYYTLEEASKLLGISSDEFKKRLQTQWKTIRRFPDQGTLRFQARDIDELARQAGQSSDVDLKLGESLHGMAVEPELSIGGKSGGKGSDELFVPERSDDFIPLVEEEDTVIS